MNFAVENNIPVLQPPKLKDPIFISELQSYKADLQVVVAFRMLPEIVWNMPPKGTLNLHASLLPDYRGAAPINHAIINGETETGVTTFFLQHAIDTGDIIFSEKMNIDPDEDAGSLHDKLMELGAKLIVKTVSAIQENNYVTTPQSGISNKTAPKIFKETCQINWNQPVEQVYNFIRGLSPYPGAYTMVNGKMIKIFKVSMSPGTPTSPPGTLINPNNNIQFTTANGLITVLQLQPEGKKRMSTEEFLRGNKL